MPRYFSDEWDNIYDYIDSLDIPSQEGNKNMDKKYGVFLPSNFAYKTYEDAVKKAKQMTAGRIDVEYVIAQAIAQTMAPVPEIEVVKL
jgi:hypothetical protein